MSHIISKNISNLETHRLCFNHRNNTIYVHLMYACSRPCSQIILFPYYAVARSTHWSAIFGVFVLHFKTTISKLTFTRRTKQNKFSRLVRRQQHEQKKQMFSFTIKTYVSCMANQLLISTYKRIYSIAENLCLAPFSFHFYPK